MIRRAARWARSFLLGRRQGRDPFLPDWPRLLAGEAGLWGEALRRAQDGPKVLMANNVPSFYNSTNVESLLSAALTLRGAQVHILLCDHQLPACFNTKYRSITPASILDGSFRDKACAACDGRRPAFSELGLPVHNYSALLTEADRAEIRATAASAPLTEIPSWRLEGLAVGEHAYAGCLRYFSKGNLDGEPLASDLLRHYFEAALMSARVMLRLTGEHKYLAAVAHHGIYIPQGIVGEVCRARSVRFASWNVAYRKKCFIFSHEDTYHHTLLEEPVSAWKDMLYTDAHDGAIQEYLKTRWWGSQDWIYFHDTPDDRLETLVKETGLDPKKPVIGLLTNVMWDAQLHYRANAFPSMLDWILKTVRYFAGRPDIQLLIRVHPAELRGLQPSRQFVVEEIKKAFPALPPNVFVIGPESNVNTYAAMQQCNTVIIYGTKTGVELTSMGIPVVVAGEAWIRNKGLTTDVSSEADYFRILDGLPRKEARLPEAARREARKYAYHFFMRRMIPLKSVALTDDKSVPFRVGISSLQDLLPGADPGLDIICDGILKGEPFIYPAERLSFKAVAA